MKGQPTIELLTVALLEIFDQTGLANRFTPLAVNKYIEIISNLLEDKELIATPQDISISKNLLLKSWTPSKRYAVAKKIIDWEKNTINTPK